MGENVHISVVTPVYGHGVQLDVLYQKLRTVLSKITDDFEIIMVNDASPNNAWQVITELGKKDARVKGVNLSRNFGQHYAIPAGLSYVRGDWCVVMDCDLQDKPEEIPKLYEEAQKGFDIVVGRRANRQDSWLKITSSKLFYMVFNYLTDQKMDNAVANFGIYSNKVIKAVLQHNEAHQSFGQLITLVGFKRNDIDIVHDSRPSGSSSYSFRMRWQLAQNHILNHSVKPLKLVAKFGILVVLTTLIYAIYLIISHFLYGSDALGWTSLIVSMFFLSGVIITSLGMIGLYVGKIFDEVKQRPLYIVAETTFEKD